MSMRETWDYLEYHLATHGIPAEVDETVTANYEFDPWRPAPNTEAVRILLTKDDAASLAALIAIRRESSGDQPMADPHQPDIGEDV